MAQSLLKRAPSDPNEKPHPHYVQPSWCTCGKCTIMDTEEENRSDIRAKTISNSPESFSKAANRQYILWKYQKFGPGNRQVCPLCVVNCIKEWYPSPNGQYMGFKTQ
uniref:P2X purinoreceptor 7 intracellular domain-containing protein n=1 Tax=Amphimedon queenslandica TaxID=400682 RepID=A0A1X7UB59_AMPQE